jgi:integrase
VTTRAASGESSISKGTDGRWHGYVSMGLKEGGRRDRRHVAAAKRADVVRMVRELEDQRDAGIRLVGGRGITVEQWLDHWLTAIAVRRLRPKTYDNYSSIVRRHLVRLLGHHRLDRLQPEHVEAAWVQLSAEGLAPASVLLNHRILSRALTVAMQRGRVTRNVATLVDPPSVRRPEIVPLTEADARRVLQAAREIDNGARWSVALALGLRQGEALGVRWEDVDLDQGTLTVRHALQRRKGEGLVLVEPKSAAGRRTMALPPPLVDALRAHRGWQLQQRLAAANVWEDGGFVFAQANGRPFDAGQDWQAWKRLLTAAGVRDARLHDARHTAATLLLQQGVAARVAMQLLGHSQLSMTMHYTHVVPELAREAANGMGEALWG